MSIANNQAHPSRKGVQVGDIAPDFTLPTQSGALVSLGDFMGKVAIVLYFYPKDNTPGCTLEACSFRDSFEVFKDAGAVVIGISTDSVESHERFATQYQVPFILLSDADGVTRKLYGVPATFGLLPGRVTYVIDKQGVVRHTFSAQFAPEKHVAGALEMVQALGGE